MHGSSTNRNVFWSIAPEPEPRQRRGLAVAAPSPSPFSGHAHGGEAVKAATEGSTRRAWP